SRVIRRRCSASTSSEAPASTSSACSSAKRRHRLSALSAGPRLATGAAPHTLDAARVEVREAMAAHGARVSGLHGRCAACARVVVNDDDGLALLLLAH